MKLVDLSHPIFDSMSTYPTDPKVSFIRKKEIETDNTLLHCFTMGTHTGTHLDVPAHIIKDGKTLDNFQLNTFTGRAILVNENSYKSLDNIKEKIDGIIYDTGWYKCFNDPNVFFGLQRPAIPKKLIEITVGLGVKFFGCDLPSVDQSGSKHKPIHNALLGVDIIIYETLANLDELPVLKTFDFFGFPMPFLGLDGSPVRAVAIIS